MIKCCLSRHASWSVRERMWRHWIFINVFMHCTLRVLNWWREWHVPTLTVLRRLWTMVPLLPTIRNMLWYVNVHRVIWWMPKTSSWKFCRKILLPKCICRDWPGCISIWIWNRNMRCWTKSFRMGLLIPPFRLVLRPIKRHWKKRRMWLKSNKRFPCLLNRLCWLSK